MTIEMSTAQARVIFGDSSLRELPRVVEEIAAGEPSAFVVTDAGIAATPVFTSVMKVLEDAGIECAVFTGVKPNPNPAILDEAGQQLAASGARVVIAVGGGSSLDSAKGIALVGANPNFTSRQFDYSMQVPTPAIPIIAIPTTAGTGSETNDWGVIDDPQQHCKIYIGDASARPVATILDPSLTVGLPPRQTAGTGIDAMTHAIESLVSLGRTPIGMAYAHEALRLIRPALPRAVRDGSDLQARADMLLGAHLAGLALTSCGLGLVHGIAHSVSARTGAAHGEALAAVLAEVMDFNQPVDPDAFAGIARDLDTSDPVSAVRDLADDVNIRMTLTELGVGENLVASVADGALADVVTRNNPRTPSREEVLALVQSRL